VKQASKQAMNMYGGMAVQLHTISALGRHEWSTSNTGQFMPRRSPWYPLDRRMGGTQSWPEHGGEEKYPWM